MTFRKPILRPLRQNQFNQSIQESLFDTKVIHFLRHAEGEHNVVGDVDYDAYRLEKFEDASLSKFGISQCLELSCDDELKESIKMCDLVVMSPMRRTIQTASFCFPFLVSKAKWIAHESVRERLGEHPCNRRRPINELSTYFPHIDFNECNSNLDSLYPTYGNELEPVEDIIQRCNTFLNWLHQREEKEVIVVSHSGFLWCILSYCVHVQLLHVDQEDKFETNGFNNCELRSYTISWKN